MTTIKRLLSISLCAIALTSCATEITGSTESTIAPVSTTTIPVAPTGSIISLLEQLVPVADGLKENVRLMQIKHFVLFHSLLKQ